METGGRRVPLRRVWEMGRGLEHNAARVELALEEKTNPLGGFRFVYLLWYTCGQSSRVSIISYICVTYVV